MNERKEGKKDDFQNFFNGTAMYIVTKTGRNNSFRALLGSSPVFVVLLPRIILYLVQMPSKLVAVRLGKQVCWLLFLSGLRSSH